MKSKHILPLSLLFAVACAPEEEAQERTGRDGRTLTGAAAACDHDVCEDGGPLLPSCSDCSAAICAQDPYCCEVAWDGLCVAAVEFVCLESCEPPPPPECVHPICEEGAALDPACDPCAASICASDAFCCNNSWDSICVAEVATICGQSCAPPAPECDHPICDAGGPLDPACDPCAASVCAADPYCCSDQWDRVCIREVETVCGQTCGPPSGDAIDIVFVVDNSASMAEEQGQLGAQAPVLFSYLAAQGYDFRIGVTTTDVDMGGQQGAFVGPLIDSANPDPAGAFAMQVDVGINGSAFEQGLEASRLALTNNAGFPRADAALLVVYLSDEEDQSPDTVAAYQSFLLGFPDVQANAIVGTSTASAGCFSSFGDRYQQVVGATGGTTVSICNPDWSPALTGF